MTRGYSIILDILVDEGEDIHDVVRDIGDALQTPKQRYILLSVYPDNEGPIEVNKEGNRA